MIKVSKSYLRRFGLAAIVVGLVVVSVVSVASASPSVAITSPSLGNVDLYFDANGNGQHDAGEFVGTFPAYPGSGITLHWDSYTFPAGVNGSYYVALWQNTTPLGPDTWVERKAGHHFANNPSTDYLMGPFFSYEDICENCPSIILVSLETYSQVGNDILYAPFMAALSAGEKPSGFAESDEFVLQALPGKQFKSNGGGGGPNNVCTSPNQSKSCCAAAGGNWEEFEGEFFCNLDVQVD